MLIGETYLPNTAELDKWYGGAKKDELQLPMDMIVGLSNKLDANTFRERISEVETQVHGSQPLLVFDNHDNSRSWDRYGDGVHNEADCEADCDDAADDARDGADVLRRGDGDDDSTPTRVEDVKDPIGITGWPKEKGRDGERTPMQWDAGAAMRDSPTRVRRRGCRWLPNPQQSMWRRSWRIRTRLLNSTRS